MKTCKEFRLTPHDAIAIYNKEYENWLVYPVMIHRDTCEYELDYANYYYTLKELSDLSNCDYDQIQITHWTHGYFEILIVRPDTGASQICESLIKKMLDYPVLSDEFFSECECNYASDMWSNDYFKREYLQSINENVDDSVDLSDLEMPCEFIQYICHH